MTIQQLKYFLDASKSLNFSRTAEAFYISQSAVTQQIKHLEEELDAKLFARKKGRMVLTDAGRVFATEARGIIIRTEDAVRRVHAARDGRVGALNVGYLKCIEMSRFPKTIQSFHEKYPGVQLHLERNNAMALRDRFVSGKYDIIFQVEHPLLTYPGAAYHQLGTYSVRVVVPPDHPLASQERVSQSDLKDIPLIIHDFQRSIPGAAQLPRRYLDAELMENIISTEDDVETILLMVAAGNGVAVLPEFDTWKPQINLNLVYLPLDTGDYRASLRVYYAEDNPNPLIPLFLEEV